MSGILFAALAAEHTQAERIRAMLTGTYTQVTTIARVGDAAQAQVARADMLIIPISPGWAERVEAEPGISRAIASGLSRSDLPVLVIHLDDADPPPVTDLPSELRAIPYMNNLIVHTDDRFETDVAALARRIADILEETAGEAIDTQMTPAAAATLRSRRRPRRHIPFNLIMVAAILIFGFVLIIFPQFEENAPALPEPGDTNGAGAASQPSADLLLGLAAGLSGSTEDLGREILNGVQLALADRPAVLIEGEAHTVDLLIQDTGCSAIGGQRVAETFVAAPNLAAVVGHMCDASCSAALPVYETAGLPTVSPSCSEPALTTTPTDTFNRVVPSRADEARAAARFIAESLAAEGAAVIHDEQQFGRQFAAAFAETYPELSGFYSTETGTIDYDTLIDTALGNGATALYFAGRPVNAAELRLGLVEREVDIPYVIAIQGDLDAYLATAGDAADGTFMLSLAAATSSAYDDLAARYQTEYGLAPTTARFAYAYDATNIILDAVEATTSANEDGSLQIDYAALQTAIRAYQSEGVTGPLDCSPDGDCAEGRALIFVVQSGGLTPYEQP
ncbi:MAG: branched-chain amino acid ABC transporter substrate-binding protein [Chloroflexota bacterium]